MFNMGMRFEIQACCIRRLKANVDIDVMLCAVMGLWWDEKRLTDGFKT